MFTIVLTQRRSFGFINATYYLISSYGKIKIPSKNFAKQP